MIGHRPRMHHHVLKRMLQPAAKVTAEDKVILRQPSSSSATAHAPRRAGAPDRDGPRERSFTNQYVASCFRCVFCRLLLWDWFASDETCHKFSASRRKRGLQKHYALQYDIRLRSLRMLGIALHKNTRRYWHECALRDIDYL